MDVIDVVDATYIVMERIDGPVRVGVVRVRVRVRVRVTLTLTVTPSPNP